MIPKEIYRLPCSPVSEFLDEFPSLVEILGARPSPSIMCGDFNIHMDIPACAAELLQLLDSVGLQQHIHLFAVCIQNWSLH